MRQFLLGLLPLIVCGAWAQTGESIVDTPHNLSASGPGSIKALDEERVCIFCHTPHGSSAQAPLWNRFDSTESYTPYDSTTLDASPGQPTGSSKLCLSCHDGTIALGQLISESGLINMAGGSTTLPDGHGLIGTDLSDDHPISFVPVSDPELAPPDQWGDALSVDAAGQMQCMTCHDVHDNTFGDFLVMDNTVGQMCQVCHRLEGWSLSSHAQTQTAALSHVNRIPGGCGLCHTPHGAGGTPLRRGPAEEDTCLTCHSGSDPSAANIAAVMSQPYGHIASRSQGVHHPTENPTEAARHAECSDCHNPHRSTDRPSSGLADPGGALDGVRGVTLSGVQIDEARHEYEVCLRCHSGSQTSPQGFPVRRVLEQFDLAKEIDPSNPSFHPVAAPGRNLNVPSLIAPMTENSTLRCSDCHRSSHSDAAGPHGSINAGLLGGTNETGDHVMEGPRAYGLCYECHSRTSILNDESFPTHRLHVEGDRTSCSVCHDPHGVSLTQGDPMEHTHLINFDATVVQPDPVTGRLTFVDLGEQAGTCYLSCHGKAHSPLAY